MPIRVGIDGFGGLSRQFFMAVQAGGFSDLFEISVINDPAGAGAIAQRLRRDSVYGRSSHAISFDAGQLQVGGREICVTDQPDSEKLDWEKSGADIVVIDAAVDDAAARARNHLEKGARKVIVAGRGFDDTTTVVFGLNDGSYDPDTHNIVSTGSAAVNALAPLASVLQQGFGIARGSFTIVHPLDARQPVRDTIGGESRMVRSGIENIVPGMATQTNAELALVHAALDGKLDGVEVYVPVAPVGWITLSTETERRFEREDAVKAFTDAATSESFSGLLGIADGGLVSSDFNGDPRSVVVDIGDVTMIGRAFVSVRGWFDAEWGLACRAADLVALVCEAGVPGTA